ncbi:hypothetical protein J2S42_000576 [Catenuloplanes indicus]|uniref:Bacterial transcriptional activator domain-containing protein n=1 Tax=Catenuloplanes indicus TaxID=137267 RepID=A0AAE3VVE0_9ACTN|nr:hypothetical protein [Catenuloplanes indicus]
MRKQLEPSVRIIRQRPGYLLRMGSADFDYDTFRRVAQTGHHALRRGEHQEAARHLRAALALWRGRPLMNVTDLLADAELPALQESRLAAAKDRIDADLALGQHAELVPELSALLAEHPLQECLRIQLMTALYRAGRQAEALDVYHDGRLTLADSLGVEPSPALFATYKAILDGDLELVPPPERAQVTVRPVITPRMLPADITDFTARDAEVSAIRAFLGSPPSGSHPSVLLITGLPGVGKSAIGTHGVHRCRDRFPDGELHADLRGSTDAPVDPGVVLGWFLRGLGVAPDDIPDSTPERQQLYRSQLAGRRLVVVLDDAADSAQVRPLLPGGATCRVIVTSRSYPGVVEASRSLEIRPWSTEASLSLLADIISHDRVARRPHAARRIADLCAGLPMAVRILGARLAAKPHLAIDKLARRVACDPLRELRLGPVTVRGNLEAMYDRLDEPHRRALRRLAAQESPAIAADTAAHLLGLTEHRAEEILEDLIDARLLHTTGGEGGRLLVGMHPFVRQLARHVSAPADPARRETPVARAPERVLLRPALA